MFIATPVFLLDYYFVCLRALYLFVCIYITHIFLTFCSLSFDFSYSGFLMLAVLFLCVWSLSKVFYIVILVSGLTYKNSIQFLEEQMRKLVTLAAFG